MHPKTLIALQDSIEHWTRLATGTSAPKESIHTTDCALCTEFYDNYCKGCPVANRVQRSYCRCTPWSEVALAFYNGGSKTPFFLAASCVQLAFLKSLLPEYCHSPLPAQNQLSMVLL